MKTALVTGGSNGIGAAIATRLLADGFYVISVDLALPSDSTLATHRLNLNLDLTDRLARGLLLDVVQRHGRLDVLVNNAGIFRRTPLLGLRDGQAEQKLLELNALVPKELIDMFSKMLLLSDTGSVINIASVRAFTASYKAAAYSLSKAMLIDVTERYAESLGPNIRVNAVAPGDIHTAMTPKEPTLLKGLVDRIALKRLGTVSEVAAVVSFLASSAAVSVNGQVICVDGGFLCS